MKLQTSTVCIRFIDGKKKPLPDSAVQRCEAILQDLPHWFLMMAGKKMHNNNIGIALLRKISSNAVRLGSLNRQTTYSPISGDHIDMCCVICGFYSAKI
ncbi:hypothetical protein CEXT_625571 [Caerostris extrusa]|uniref:LAGLIDADG homing endonuclease n=1 Tax=Caerostris extrusa TaxID=172846 RepID=A0AAV4MWU3_CAEEX|nr:hypothetical protein CEXT_625571 [Caerostris extrusa]